MKSELDNTNYHLVSGNHHRQSNGRLEVYHCPSTGMSGFSLQAYNPLWQFSASLLCAYALHWYSWKTLAAS